MPRRRRGAGPGCRGVREVGGCHGDGDGLGLGFRPGSRPGGAPLPPPGAGLPPQPPVLLPRPAPCLLQRPRGQRGRGRPSDSTLRSHGPAPPAPLPSHGPWVPTERPRPDPRGLPPKLWTRRENGNGARAGALPPRQDTPGVSGPGSPREEGSTLGPRLAGKGRQQGQKRGGKGFTNNKPQLLLMDRNSTNFKFSCILLFSETPKKAPPC